MCLGIATEAVCCAGSAVCSAACCCCKNCLGTTFGEQIRLAYITLNTCLFLFTVFCLYWIQQLFENYISFIGCPEESGGNSYCLGVSAVYRMSFVLATMYLMLIICMLVRGELAKAANEGIWFLKFLYIGCFFFGALYIPNSFFYWYIDFARIIGGIFLLFQIIMLIDVFYLWGQKWVKIYDDGVQSMSILLITTSVILYGGALTLNIFNFVWFSGCGINIFMNIFTLLLIIGVTAVQLLGWNPQGSLLTSGAMSLYITYQAFSAQALGPEESCNKLYNHQSPVMATDTALGFVLIIVALLYMTFGSAENSSQVMKVGPGTDLTSGMLETQEQKDDDKSKVDDDEEQKQPLQEKKKVEEQTSEQKLADAKNLIKEEETKAYASNQFVIFHTIMFISVIYMAMMLSDWGAANINDTTTAAYKHSGISYWVQQQNNNPYNMQVKMILSWTAGLLYIWTLVAPHIFPERDFT